MALTPIGVERSEVSGWIDRRRPANMDRAEVMQWRKAERQRLIGERLAINGDVRPVVGFDQACYRLGYGGGFFDRILATMKNSPLKLGVGYRQQVLLTIHPQPNDVPMDMVNTEEGACLASKSSRPPKALAQ